MTTSAPTGLPAAEVQAAVTAPETLEAAPAQQAMAESVAYAAPVPVYSAPAPVKRAAAAPAKQKSGMSVGVFAGAAVAAVTLLAAGVTIVKSGGKKGEKAPQKAPSRSASGSKAASKPSTRSTTARYRLLLSIMGLLASPHA